MEKIDMPTVTMSGTGSAGSGDNGTAEAATAVQEALSMKIDVAAMANRMQTPGADRVLERREIVMNIGLLLLQSPAHRYFFLSDLEWLIYPPIQLRQFKLYMNEERPVGYVSWALLSDDAEQRFMASRRLAPGDWRTGDRVWVIDLVAPFGGAEAIFSDLRGKILAGKTFKRWRLDEQGNRQIDTILPLEETPNAA